MKWQSAFRGRNPSRQQLFDQDLAALTAPQAAMPSVPQAAPQNIQPHALPSAMPTAQPKPVALGPSFGQMPPQTLQQPSPFQGQQSFGYPRSLPQTAAPQAQDNLSNWLTRMMQRSSGQQQMPGWRGGGNALAQGWRGR